MSDLDVGKFGKKSGVDLSTFKGGLKKDQLKSAEQKSIFNALDADGNGVLDESEIKEFKLSIDKDGDNSVSKKEAKKFLKEHDLKDLDKKELLKFLKAYNVHTENVKDSKIINQNGKTSVQITYKDGTTEILNQDKTSQITQTDANGTTTTRFLDENKKLLKSKEETKDGETTETEYAEDGQTPVLAEIKSKNGRVSTIVYENGKPSTKQVRHGAVTSNFSYDENGNEVLESKIENEGIPAKEKKTEYQYNDDGTVTATVTENGKTTVQQLKDGKVSSEVSTTSSGTTESVYHEDGTRTETVTDKNGNTTTTVYNSENNRLTQTKIVDGKEYNVEYDGQGNTKLVLQNGESIENLAKKFGTTKQEVLDANGGRVRGWAGDDIVVPGELEADDKRLQNRQSAEEAKAAYKAVAEEIERVNTEAAARENITFIEKTHDTFEELARGLFKGEGVENPTKRELQKRIEQLKEANPDLKDGELKGKKINAPVSPEIADRIRTKENKRKEKIKAAENTNIQKQSASEIVNDLVDATKGWNDTDKIKSAIARIDNPEELAEVNRLLAQKGYKADDKYSSIEKFIYEENNHSYVHTYNSSDYLEQTVQKWIDNGTLQGDAANKAQARMAARVIFDGGDGFGTNCDKIKNGVHMIKCPKPTGDPKVDNANAKAVYDEVNRIVKNHNTFYGLGSPSDNLRDYCKGEMWESEVRYLDGILAENNSIQGKQKQEAIVNLTKEAVSGGGTDIEYLKQALKGINSKEDRAEVEKLLKEYCDKKGIKPQISGQDSLQAILYDECDTFLGVSKDHKEIRKFNEMLISQGAYTEEETVNLRAEQAALQALEGGFSDIKDAVAQIKDPKVLSGMEKLLKTKGYKSLDDFLTKTLSKQTDRDLIYAELAKNEVLSDSKAAEVAARLVQNADFDTRAMGLQAIRSEGAAKLVDDKLKAKGSSLEKVWAQFNTEKSEYASKAQFWDGLAARFGIGLGNVMEHVSDAYHENTDMSDVSYVKSSNPVELSAEQKTAYEMTVKTFEESLNKAKASYEQARESQGVVSGAINEFASVYNLGTTRDEIEARMQYEEETLRLLKLASKGELSKMVNGKAVPVTFEEIFNERQSKVVNANASGVLGLNPVSNSQQVNNVQFNSEKVEKVANKAQTLAAMDYAKDNIAVCWDELSSASNSTDIKVLATAIYDTLEKLSSMSGKELSLESFGYELNDGIIVDSQGNPVGLSELKEITSKLQQGLSDVSSSLFGQKIPLNSSTDKVRSMLDKAYDSKLEDFKEEYKDAFGNYATEDDVEKYISTIQTGMTIINVGTAIGAVIAAPFTGGGSLAVFALTAATTMGVNALEKSTDANGYTNSEWTSDATEALWNGALAATGFKVGQVAEKFAQGGYKVAASVISKNKNVIQKIAPNISEKTLEKASVIVSRAEAAGIEISSDTLQSLVQSYCMEGEFNEEAFMQGLLMSVAGNVAGHAFSVRGDIKANSVETGKITDGTQDASHVKKVKKSIIEEKFGKYNVKKESMRLLQSNERADKIALLSQIKKADGTQKLSTKEIEDILDFVEKSNINIPNKTLYALINAEGVDFDSIGHILFNTKTPEQLQVLDYFVNTDSLKLSKGNLVSNNKIMLTGDELNNILANIGMSQVTGYAEFLDKIIKNDLYKLTTSNGSQAAFLNKVTFYLHNDAQKDTLLNVFSKIKDKNSKINVETSKYSNINSDELLKSLNYIGSDADAKVLNKLFDKYISSKDIDKDSFNDFINKLSNYSSNHSCIEVFEALNECKNEYTPYALDRILWGYTTKPGFDKDLVLNGIRQGKSVDSIIYVNSIDITNLKPDDPRAFVYNFIKTTGKYPNDAFALSEIPVNSDFEKKVLTKLLEANAENRLDSYAASVIFNKVKDEKSFVLLEKMLQDKNADVNSILKALGNGDVDPSILAEIDRRVNLKSKLQNISPSDVAKVKQELNIGFEPYARNVLKLKISNPKRYQKMVDSGLFELISQGKVNINILKNIDENTFLSNRTLADIRKIRDGKSYITTLSSPADLSNISKYVEPGDVCEVNGKLYVNDEGTAVEIKMTRAKFEELFPPLNRVSFEQKGLGDCWLVTTFDNFMDLPGGQAALYKLMSQDGDDILIKFPNGPHPIRFPNGKVKPNGRAQIGAVSGNNTSEVAPGILMLEQAYAVHRFRNGENRYITSAAETNISDITNISELMDRLRGGWQYDAVKDILGNDKCTLNKYGTNLLNKTEMRDLIIKTSNDKNVLTYFATKHSDFSSRESLQSLEYDLHSGHAYSIKGYDPATDMVYITNPWHTSVVTEVPLYELLKYIDDVNVATIKGDVNQILPTPKSTQTPPPIPTASRSLDIEPGDVSMQRVGSPNFDEPAPGLGNVSDSGAVHSVLSDSDIKVINRYSRKNSEVFEEMFSEFSNRIKEGQIPSRDMMDSVCQSLAEKYNLDSLDLQDSALDMMESMDDWDSLTRNFRRRESMQAGSDYTEAVTEFRNARNLYSESHVNAMDEILQTLETRVINGEIPSSEMLHSVAEEFSKKYGVNIESLLDSTQDRLSSTSLKRFAGSFKRPLDKNLKAIEDGYSTYDRDFAALRKSKGLPEKTEAQLKQEADLKEAELKAQQEAELKAKQDAERIANERQALLDKYADKYSEVVTFDNFRSDDTKYKLIELMENYDLNMSYKDFDTTRIYSKIYESGITNDADMDIAFNMIKERYHADVIAEETRIKNIKSQYKFYSDESIVQSDSVIEKLKQMDNNGEKFTLEDIDNMLYENIYDVRDFEKMRQRILENPELTTILNDNLHLDVYSNPKYQGFEDGIPDAMTIFDNILDDIKNGKPLTLDLINNHYKSLDDKLRANGGFVSSESLWILQDVIRSHKTLGPQSADFIEDLVQGGFENTKPAGSPLYGESGEPLAGGWFGFGKQKTTSGAKSSVELSDRDITKKVNENIKRAKTDYGNVATSQKLATALEPGTLTIKDLGNNFNLSDISKSVKNGDVCSVGQKLYVNQNGQAVELKISKEKFEELFPKTGFALVEQNGYNNCWLVSRLNSMTDSAYGRSLLYLMLEETPDGDILVNLANSSNPVRFPGGKPVNVPNALLGDGASPGLEMIHQAVLVKNLQKAQDRVDDISKLNLSSLHDEANALTHTDINATRYLIGSSSPAKSGKDVITALESFKPGKDMGVITWEQHARSVTSYNPQTRMITYHDPYYAGVDITESIDDLMKKNPYISIKKAPTVSKEVTEANPINTNQNHRETRLLTNSYRPIAETSDGQPINAMVSDGNVIINKNGQITPIPLSEIRENGYVSIREKSTNTYIIIEPDKYGGIKITSNIQQNEIIDSADIETVNAQSNNNSSKRVQDNSQRRGELNSDVVAHTKTNSSSARTSSPLPIPKGFREYGKVMGRRAIINNNNEVMYETKGVWKRLN